MSHLNWFRDTLALRISLRLAFCLATCYPILQTSQARGQVIAVVSSDTRTLNEEFNRVYWDSGGKGYPPPIGSTVRIVTADRSKPPVTIRAGSRASACLFNEGKSILVASSESREGGILVSTFETTEGRLVSKFTVPKLRKFWNLPTNKRGPDFVFNDLVYNEREKRFVLLAESTEHSIPPQPGEPTQQCSVLAFFDAQELGSVEVLEKIPSMGARFLSSSVTGTSMIGATLIRQQIGRVTQISQFQAPGAAHIMGEIPEYLLGPYAINSNEKLMFISAGQLEQIEFSASLLGELSRKLAANNIPPQSKSNNRLVALFPIGSSGDSVRCFRQEIIPGLYGSSYTLELFRAADNKPEEVLLLDNGIVAIRFNRKMDRMVVLAKKVPQLRIFSVKGFKELDVIDHVLDNPTDCYVW